MKAAGASPSDTCDYWSRDVGKQQPHKCTNEIICAVHASSGKRIDNCFHIIIAKAPIASRGQSRPLSKKGTHLALFVIKRRSHRAIGRSITLREPASQRVPSQPRLPGARMQPCHYGPLSSIEPSPPPSPSCDGSTIPSCAGPGESLVESSIVL